MKEQKIGLGDLVRSDTDQVQGIVVGGSLDGSRVSLNGVTRLAGAKHTLSKLNTQETLFHYVKASYVADQNTCLNGRSHCHDFIRA